MPRRPLSKSHRGYRRHPAPPGVEISVHLATLPDGGPTGVLYGYLWSDEGGDSFGVLPW